MRQVRGFDLRRNEAATAGLDREAIVELTRRATESTFYSDSLTAEQVAANDRIPAMGGDAFVAAAGAPHQHLAAAFAAGRPAGFMIATRHAADELELDWLMVDPSAHGSGLAATLMTEGLAWLGMDRPIWLTVLRHNERAIRFYRKFGFEIDRETELVRTVPSWVMRRPPLEPAR
jgi:ribosomal protein S18 acetylase RimI-like enzyme